MNNDELIQEMARRIESGELSREVVLTQLQPQANVNGVLSQSDVKNGFHMSLSKVLYFFGGLVVLAGIIFLFGQIWEDIGSFGRIFVTLILGLVFAGFGSILFQSKPESHLGSVFHAIAGFLVPGGAFVTLDELFVSTGSLWPVVAVFGIMFVWYFALNLYHRHAVLTLFTIVNGTIFIYTLVDTILQQSLFDAFDVVIYLTMLIGVVYLLLAYAFQNTWNQKLVGILNFFGVTSLLGAAFDQVFDSGVWQVFFFLLVAGGVLMAIYRKSRSILVMSTLFLIAHFAYITSEYFADSIGWPVALIFLGLIFIGLGYISISINKKYISTTV